MRKKTENSDKPRFSWLANLPTNIPVFCAVAGMLYALIVLCSGGRGKAYHDLYLDQKRETVSRLIQNRIKILSGKFDSLRSSENPCSLKDSDKVKVETLKRINELLASSRTELRMLEYFNTDTTLKFYSRYFSADREKYLDTLLKGSHLIPVLVKDTFSSVYYNPLLPDLSQLRLATDRKKPGLMDYFNKYPLMGFWFFLSLVQAALWFITVPLAVGSVRKTNTIVPNLPYNRTNAFFFAIIPLIVALPSIGIFYMKLASDKDPLISNHLFLEGFNTRMAWYGLPGYLVSIICLGIYIFLGNKLQMLDKDAQKTRSNIATNKNLQAEYQSLKASFDFAFLLSAILLSVSVLWLGALFNAVNGIEAMQFYTLLSGKTFLNYNFVYLAGMFHTVILLIFYIPVKIQFNSLPITQDVNTASQDPNANRVFRSFWEATSAILIPAAPLITTILQKLITGLLGN